MADGRLWYNYVLFQDFDCPSKDEDAFAMYKERRDFGSIQKPTLMKKKKNRVKRRRRIKIKSLFLMLTMREGKAKWEVCSVSALDKKLIRQKMRGREREEGRKGGRGRVMVKVIEWWKTCASRSIKWGEMILIEEEYWILHYLLARSWICAWWARGIDESSWRFSLSKLTGKLQIAAGPSPAANCADAASRPAHS